MKKPKFQRPTGMRDILPEDQKFFQRIYDVCEKVVDFYGFKKIETPILEDTALYQKGTGLTSEIVQKQMFTLRTRGGDSLTLRPEFTPGTIRAYLEQGMQSLPQPIKLYSIGPVFRYEHPQAGRYRQFYQFNLEVIGENSPVVDAQVIQIFYNILKGLKLKKVIVEINSIGDSQCRPHYKKVLLSYLRARSSGLCLDCRRRIRENPLRVLDCKEEKCQRQISQAPQTIDHLCQDCHYHFKEVLEFLDEAEVPYHLNPFLVRGLDYYSRTTFEIFFEEQKEKQKEEVFSKNALAGGGRYDGLVKLLGGEETGAVGGAIGIERVVAALKAGGLKFKTSPSSSIFLAQLGSLAKRKSLKLIEEFRKNKIQVSESLCKDSLRAQFKIADKIGAKYTLLLGQKEALEEKIIIRDMETGKQETVKLDKAVEEIKKILKK